MSDIFQPKILIVDDKSTNRMTLRILLKKLGNVTLFEAENGQDAIEKTKEHQPDIIFMDIMMPEMDGIEATRLLKEDETTKKSLIIALTALHDDEIQSQMLQAGADDFLTKPFNYEEVFLLTKNYIQRLTPKATKPFQEYRKTINLYGDKSIKNYKVVFNIANQSDCDSFWDYFKEGNYPNEIYNETLTLLYNIIGLSIRSHYITTLDIVVEETPTITYFTIWNPIVVRAALRFIEKFEVRRISMRHNDEKISFKVDKNTIHTLSCSTQGEHEHKNEFSMMIDNDDKKEFFDIAEDLSELISLLYSRGFAHEAIEYSVRYIGRLAQLLSSYRELEWMSEIIGSLQILIHDNKEAIIENGALVIPLFDGIVSNIKFWMREIFIVGCEDVHFMDDSLKADIDTIKTFISQPLDDTNSAVDDIFNF